MRVKADESDIPLQGLAVAKVIQASIGEVCTAGTRLTQDADDLRFAHARTELSKLSLRESFTGKCVGEENGRSHRKNATNTNESYDECAKSRRLCGRQ